MLSSFSFKTRRMTLILDLNLSNQEGVTALIHPITQVVSLRIESVDFIDFDTANADGIPILDIA